MELEKINSQINLPYQQPFLQHLPWFCDPECPWKDLWNLKTKPNQIIKSTNLTNYQLSE